MELTCKDCGYKYSVPQEKVPIIVNGERVELLITDKSDCPVCIAERKRYIYID